MVTNAGNELNMKWDLLMLNVFFHFQTNRETALNFYMDTWLEVADS